MSYDLLLFLPLFVFDIESASMKGSDFYLLL